MIITGHKGTFLFALVLIFSSCETIFAGDVESQLFKENQSEQNSSQIDKPQILQVYPALSKRKLQDIKLMRKFYLNQHSIDALASGTERIVDWGFSLSFEWEADQINKAVSKNMNYILAGL